MFEEIKSAFDELMTEEMDDIVLRKLNTTYNDNTGTSSTTPTTYNGKGFKQNVRDEFLASIEVDSLDGEIVILQDSLSVEPENGNEIDLNGTTYQVVAVQDNTADFIWTVGVQS